MRYRTLCGGLLWNDIHRAESMAVQSECSLAAESPPRQIVAQLPTAGWHFLSSFECKASQDYTCDEEDQLLCSFCEVI